MCPPTVVQISVVEGAGPTEFVRGRIATTEECSEKLRRFDAAKKWLHDCETNTK